MIKQVSNSLPTDGLQLLLSTIGRINGASKPATIRTYFADFATFITFCHLHHRPALPANLMIVSNFIVHIGAAGRSSTRVRRDVLGISAIHLINRFTDSTKDPEVRTTMKRMHRTLERVSNQGYVNWQDVLCLLLANVSDSIRGLRDVELL